MFLLFVIIFLIAFHISAYVFAGIYLMKEVEKNNDDKTLWSVAHWAGYIVFGFFPFSIYFFSKNKVFIGLIALIFPIIVSLVAFVFLIIYYSQVSY